MMPELENSTAPKLYLMQIIKKYRIRPPLGYVYEAYMKHMDFAFLLGFQLKGASLYTHKLETLLVSSTSSTGYLTCIMTLFSRDVTVCLGNHREPVIGLT